MANDALPEKANRKVTNIVRDSQLAIVVGLFPILGLIYILRLVQWYLLRKEYPALGTSDEPVAADFRSARHRLWFAVLFWPALILFIVVFFQLT